MGDRRPGNDGKLIATLNPRKNYVLHYRNLQFYLDHGLVLTKIHRVIQFNQSPWMKDYIDLNTNKRKEAETDFEKDFFKLGNNSVFGKTMENKRNRVDVKIVRGDEKRRLEKLIAKPSFARLNIFPNGLGAVHNFSTLLK